MAEHPAPRSTEVEDSPRTAVIRRPLFRTVLLATVACVALTSYVAWQRLGGTELPRKAEQPTQAALPERRLVPFLIGATQEEAVKLLKREGFELGSVSRVAVPNPDKRGKVDSQRPPHGSAAKPGTTVDLLIGE
jgi:hypothetical protein